MPGWGEATDDLSSAPKVGVARQPWAGGRNPFGIVRGHILAVCSDSSSARPSRSPNSRHASRTRNSTALFRRHLRTVRESQRDSVPKPRVARNELPWVIFRQTSQPQRGCGQSVPAPSTPSASPSEFFYARPLRLALRTHSRSVSLLASKLVFPPLRSFALADFPRRRSAFRINSQSVHENTGLYSHVRCCCFRPRATARHFTGAGRV